MTWKPFFLWIKDEGKENYDNSNDSWGKGTGRADDKQNDDDYGDNKVHEGKNDMEYKDETR